MILFLLLISLSLLVGSIVIVYKFLKKAALFYLTLSVISFSFFILMLFILFETTNISKKALDADKETVYVGFFNAKSPFVIKKGVQIFGVEAFLIKRFASLNDLNIKWIALNNEDDSRNKLLSYEVDIVIGAQVLPEEEKREKGIRYTNSFLTADLVFFAKLSQVMRALDIFSDEEAFKNILSSTRVSLLENNYYKILTDILIDSDLQYRGYRDIDNLSSNIYNEEDYIGITNSLSFNHYINRKYYQFVNINDLYSQHMPLLVDLHQKLQFVFTVREEYNLLDSLNEVIDESKNRGRIVDYLEKL